MDIPPSKLVIRGPTFIAQKRFVRSSSSKREKEESSMKRKCKQFHATLQPNYADLIQHDPITYSKWESLYNCCFFCSLQRGWKASNPKPTSRNPATIPLVPNVQWKHIKSCPYLNHMSETTDCDETFLKPIISIDLIKKFLARVHYFTYVGLEAQATAYSRGINGVMSLLLKVRGSILGSGYTLIQIGMHTCHQLTFSNCT